MGEIFDGGQQGCRPVLEVNAWVSCRWRIANLGVLPSSSVAGIELNYYEAGYYRRIRLQQF
jgi:hypothetical protein